MEDKKQSSVAPRKMKFMPKIPPKKEPKLVKPKPEPLDTTDSTVIDSKLLNLVKQAEQGHGKRVFRSERKTAPAQVAFGNVDARSSRSFNLSRSIQKDSDGKALKAEKDYEEPWNYDTEYPVTLPLRLPHSGNPEVLDEVEFGKDHRTYDEARINAAKDLGLMEDGRGQMIFFQFPSSMPLEKRSVTASNGKEECKKGGKPENVCGKLENTPAGFMGKLLVYKSGRVKLKLGDALFDVCPGQECMFSQDVMAIDIKEKHIGVLGELTKRAVVTPDLDSMLDTAVNMN